jgi:uncharacterized membrane protein YkoI
MNIDPKAVAIGRVLSALAVAALLFGAGSGPASADSDHDAARRAVERGEIRPLNEILPSLRERVPGEIVGVELDREHGIWVYEIKVLDPGGRRTKVYVDARTGEILKSKSRNR